MVVESDVQDRGLQMLTNPGNIRRRMTGVLRHMLMIATYLGVLLSLFAIHRYLLLNDGGLASHIGFSFLNAWALAKVILVGQELRIGDSFRNRAVIYVIVIKSAMFAVLLLVFRLIEEAVIGAVEGKSLYDAIFSERRGFEQHKFEGIVLVCLIMFFALIPFFAYLELDRVLGDSRMRTLIFGSSPEHLPEDDGAFVQTQTTMSHANLLTGSALADSEGVTGEGLTSVVPDYELSQSDAYQDYWYYERAGEVMGPVSELELMHLSHLGIIGPATLVHNISIGEGWRLLQETSLG